MKVLFLDIDGVVNCRTTVQRHQGFIGIDPMMAFLVGKIQLDTDCQIVLSSDWRHSPDGVEEVEARVAKLLDKTKSLDITYSIQRGSEIKEWLDRHPDVTRYAILDDNNNMLDEQQKNFFKTSWATGITPEIALAVTNHLNT